MKYQETVKKLGVKKDNTISNTTQIFKVYKIKNYILMVKITGRYQYLLLDNDFKILINSENQVTFIKQLEKYFTYQQNINIGAILKKIRKRKNVSPQVLATQIEKKYSTLRAYENGNLRIDSQILQKILKKLDVSLNEYIQEFNNYITEQGYDIKFFDLLIHKEIKKETRGEKE